MHPVDELTTTNSTAATALALAPVRCIDCEQYVPLGWVEYATIKCPKNIGASGVQYGHRVPTEVYDNIKDSIYNRFSGEASDRTSAE